MFYSIIQKFHMYQNFTFFFLIEFQSSLLPLTLFSLYLCQFDQPSTEVDLRVDSSFYGANSAQLAVQTTAKSNIPVQTNTFCSKVFSIFCPDQYVFDQSVICFISAHHHSDPHPPSRSIFMGFSNVLPSLLQIHLEEFTPPYK